MTLADAHPYALTPEQVGALLQVDQDTVRRLCKKGQLRHVRVGAQYRIRPEWVDQFMEGGSVCDLDGIGENGQQSGSKTGEPDDEASKPQTSQQQSSGLPTSKTCENGQAEEALVTSWVDT